MDFGSETSRRATVRVGDTWKCEEPPRFPTTTELVVAGRGLSFSFPPTAVGGPWPGLSLVTYQPRTEVPTMDWRGDQISKWRRRRDKYVIPRPKIWPRPTSND